MLPFGVRMRSATEPGLADLVIFAALVGCAVFLALNASLTRRRCSLRSGAAFATILFGDARSVAASVASLAPIGWLMAQIYVIAAWASLLFALPLYMTRLAYQNYVEMREMFTQTISALAEAVDKRDPFTSKHSWRVKEIAGRHRPGDAAERGGARGARVGRAAARRRQDRRARRGAAQAGAADPRGADEMNAHPVLGAQIIAPVTGSRRELPIIRHHHEWYNGSGYPDRLIGDEIPMLARILHVADAFEAMTAAPAVPHDAADRRAGDRRAAQVRRHPVRPQGRRRLRPDALGRGRVRPGSHASRPARSR